MVELVNCFEVPAGREDEFLALWHQVNAHMRAQPGYLGHRLHRALTPDARYRFVNIAQWASPQACQAAHDDRFRALVSGPEWADFRSTPGVYEVVHSAAAA